MAESNPKCPTCGSDDRCLPLCVRHISSTPHLPHLYWSCKACDDIWHEAAESAALTAEQFAVEPATKLVAQLFDSGQCEGDAEYQQVAEFVIARACRAYASARLAQAEARVEQLEKALDIAASRLDGAGNSTGVDDARRALAPDPPAAAEIHQVSDGDCDASCPKCGANCARPKHTKSGPMNGYR